MQNFVGFNFVFQTINGIEEGSKRPPLDTIVKVDKL